MPVHETLSGAGFSYLLISSHSLRPSNMWVALIRVRLSNVRMALVLLRAGNVREIYIVSSKYSMISGYIPRRRRFIQFHSLSLAQPYCFQAVVIYIQVFILLIDASRHA